MAIGLLVILFSISFVPSAMSVPPKIPHIAKIEGKCTFVNSHKSLVIFHFWFSSPDIKITPLNPSEESYNISGAFQTYLFIGIVKNVTGENVTGELPYYIKGLAIGLRDKPE